MTRKGIASGTNNAIRELGGVFGIAVLASIFTARGGYTSGHAFVSGLVPALWVGAGIVALGAVSALFIPGRNAPAIPAQGSGLTVESSPSTAADPRLSKAAVRDCVAASAFQASLASARTSAIRETPLTRSSSPSA